MLDTPKHDTSASPAEDMHRLVQERAPDDIAQAIEAAGLPRVAKAAALAMWAEARAGAADEAASCQKLLAGLRVRKIHAAVDAVAQLAVSRFAGAPWPLIELAHARARLGDHEGALALGQQISTAFPHEGDGPRFVLGALMGLGRKEEAQSLFAQVSLDPALHGLHREEWFLALGIKLGLARADYGLVTLYAAALREVLPGHVAGYVGGAMALRKLGRLEEAGEIAQRGSELHPDSLYLWKELAWTAGALSQAERAYACWEEVITRFPQLPAGYIGAMDLSTALVQPAMTRTLLARALAAFPDDKHIVATAARMALKAGEEDQANAHWRTLIEKEPENPEIRLMAAMALMKRKHGRTKRLPTVLRKLDKIHEAFPDFVPAYTAHLGVLREAGKIGEAGRMAEAAGARFPADQDLAIARAQIDEERERFGQGVAVLEHARRLSAPTAKCEAAYVRALCLAGRMENAEAACQAALEQFGEDALVLTEYVRIATRRGDWPEALRRTSFARHRRPADRAMTKLALSIRTQLVGDEGLLAAIDEGPTVGSLAAVNVSPEETAVLLSCESLGATSAGCEFGLVQRRFGAEPFGMFRWALIGIDRLTEALGNQFEHVGSEASTELAIRRESATHQEYYVVDKKVGYLTHTFVKAEDSPEDRMLKQSVRRMRFLRDKLIENLHAAEKVFIYKFAMKFDEAALRRMFAALRTYGPCTLLCVTFADQNHPKGELQMLETGLFVGRTGMFMDAVVPDEQGVDTQTWFAHCRDVVAWHRAQRAAPGVAA